MLNGIWDFKFDDKNIGEENQYFMGFENALQIKVPFAYQSKASGIGVTTRHDYVWYQRFINIKKSNDKRYILHLEGSDFLTKVYLNGAFVGLDFGAYHRQNYDLTPFIKDGDNLIVIKCEDDYSKEKCRGKQRAQDESYECYYVDTTGIYKPLWIEEVPLSYIKNVKITPFLEDKKIAFIFEGEKIKGLSLNVSLSFKNKLIKKQTYQINDDIFSCSLCDIKSILPWSIDKPHLYDLKFEIIDEDKIIDRVLSYCGFRDIIAKEGFIYLNNKKFYQKLVLDQGYWDKSNLTSPSVNALKKDIILMKEFGFNGCRKHQKTEDERFLLLADYLGYVTWVEVASAYEFSEISKKNYAREIPLILKDNYNHPSVITWTLFNESWGIKDILTSKEQQDFTVKMYNLAKEYDPFRFVISNDGWEHTKSDIITMHHYEQDADKLYSYYEDKDKAMKEIWQSHWKGAFANGYQYNGEPILFSEFGGTAYIKNTQGSKNWGYGTGVKDDEEFINRVSLLFKTLQKLDYLSGYCYTQVSDVEQEVNGLLFHNHRCKIKPAILKKVQDKKK